MAIADVQIRHLHLQGVRMLLILVGKFVLFQPLNELINFFYVVPLSITLPQGLDRFRRKNTYLASSFGL